MNSMVVANKGLTAQGSIGPWLKFPSSHLASQPIGLDMWYHQTHFYHCYYHTTQPWSKGTAN